MSMADTQNLGFTNSGNKTFNQSIKDLNSNDIQSGVQMTSTIGSNFQKISNAIKQKKQAKLTNALAPVIEEASRTRPEIAQRKYVRPEDMAFGTQQMGQAYGAGTNFLAEDGAMIGGNPTEIQNMYNPGDIYSDMGYEPLSDSEIVKQYRRGGFIPKAEGGLGLIQEGVNMAGDLTAGIIGIGTNKLNKESNQILGQAAFQSGMQGVQEGQYSGFMEDGGEVGLKYLSHDWQPQVITQFGGYDMKDLLKDDPTMDTLRAGGHLKNYTAPSARAMQTYAMGGELQTHWGGEAEPISYNPYLPDGGETVMFRGQSHEESDGQGRTGIGVTYGDNPVEVERGEPAVKLKDGGEEESLVVYGNMKIPSYGAAELGDPKVKGKKFKSYANDLSKMEARQNKTVEKGLKLIDSIDSDNPFDLLKLQAGQAMVEGGNMKLKGLAIQKQRLAGIQNAILDTAEEMGLESDALSKGKIKKAKDSDMAKFGAKMETAQGGINQPLSPILPMSTYYRIDPRPYSPMVTSPEIKKRLEESKPKKAPAKKAVSKKEEKLNFSKLMKIDPEADKKMSDEFYAKNPDVRTEAVRALDPFHAAEPGLPAFKTPTSSTTETEDKFGIDDALRQLQPYLIPSNQEPLDPNQLTPEMYALATSQLEPVQAQTFQPLLEQPYSVSLQDQLNANQADFNALQRQVGYNPAALSQLAAQKYSANSAILGQQARINQEMQMGAFNRNRGILNDAALKNLAILDQQYQRQSQAKSATKAQAQSALSSIADKIAKNKLENRTLGVYENMYNYRFGPKGRAINVNAPYDFNTQIASMSTQEIEKLLEQKKEAEKKAGKKEPAKNGNIVKAIKNL